MSGRLTITLPSCLHSRLVHSCASPRTVFKDGIHIRALTTPALPSSRIDSSRLPQPLDGTENSPRPSSIETTFLHAKHHPSDRTKLKSTANSGTSLENNERKSIPHNLSDRLVAVRADKEHNTPVDSSTACELRPLTERWPLVGKIKWEDLYSRLKEARIVGPEHTRALLSEHHEFAVAFTSDQNVVQFLQKWEALTTIAKTNTLPSLLIGCLVDSAALTLFVLSNIAALPRQFHLRMQCLRHIHLSYPQELVIGMELRTLYEHQITQLRSSEMWQCNDMPIAHLDTLLHWSNADQCQTITEAFLKQFPFARPESLLPIITSYTRHGDTSKALEFFKQLPAELLQNPTAPVQNARDHLLKRDTITKSETGSNFSILPQILALGMEPDAALHNAVLEAAIANGVSDVAWDLYHYLKQNKLAINSRSHLVLLKDAFQRSNVSAVNEIMTEIHADKDLVQDPYLITYSMNIVRNICFHERKLPSYVALSHIMALYDRAFDRTILHRLRILKSGDRATEDSGLPEPGPGPLAFTIWTYILVQHSGQPVFTLWHRIKQLIELGDQAIVAAARLDLIYNSLILFYARTPSTMLKALEVLKYMLDIKLCVPTSRTWSIMVCGFLRHNQIDQAESITRMMRLRGIEFTQIDHEYIPQGYSSAEITKRVETVLEERTMPQGLEDLMEQESMSAVHEELDDT